MIDSDAANTTKEVGNAEFTYVGYIDLMQLTSISSLMPHLRVPPGEKRSSERSRISWAYYPNVAMTNEITRSVIIT